MKLGREVLDNALSSLLVATKNAFIVTLEPNLSLSLSGISGMKRPKRSVGAIGEGRLIFNHILLSSIILMKNDQWRFCVAKSDSFWSSSMLLLYVYRLHRSAINFEQLVFVLVFGSCLNLPSWSSNLQAKEFNSSMRSLFIGIILKLL